MLQDEQNKFLQELEQDDTSSDPFADLFKEKETQEGTEDVNVQTQDDADLKPKNRRERRLEAKLQAEREAGIQLAARLEAITSSQATRTEESDYLKSIERIYGTDTPEAREATELLKAALLGVKESAKEEAVKAYEERTSKEQAAVKEAEDVLDGMLEEIEDEFDVDLTTTAGKKARTDFLKLMERMSPKDAEGNIMYYADHISVWEQYQDLVKRRPETTAKNLASRSMQTGTTANNNVADNVNERYLREHGII